MRVILLSYLTMKNFILIPFFFVLSGLSSTLAQTDPDWQNPEVFAKNNLPAHALFMANLVNSNAEFAETEKLMLDLNGTWDFFFE